MESNTRSFKKNAAWATLGSASQALSQLLALIILARMLSPFEFGMVTSATIVNQVALLICEFGVATFLVQRRRLTLSLIATGQAMAIIIGICITAVYLTGAPIIADLFGTYELISIMQAYSVLFLIFSLTTIHDALIQRELNFRMIAIADTISFIAGYAGISILCAHLGFSYWSLVIAHISQACLRCLIIRVQSQHSSLSGVRLRLIPHILNFGSGQTLSRLASLVAAQADSFIVASRMGITAIGLYGRANQLVTIPANQLGQIFDKILFPYIARQQRIQGDVKTTYLAALKGICTLSFPAAVFIWICGPEIVVIMLGDQWVDVSGPLCILALAIPFRLIHKVSDPTARALGKTYSRAWRQWVVALCVIAFTYSLSRISLSAVAWGVVISAIIDALLMMHLCKQVLSVRTTELMKAVGSGFLAGILLYACINIALMINIRLNINGYYDIFMSSILTLVVLAATFNMSKGKQV